MGHSSWSHKQLDTTETTEHTHHQNTTEAQSDLIYKALLQKGVIYFPPSDTKESSLEGVPHAV